MRNDAESDGVPGGRAVVDPAITERSALAMRDVTENSRRSIAAKVVIVEGETWPPIRGYGWAQDERGHAVFGSRR